MFSNEYLQFWRDFKNKCEECMNLFKDNNIRVVEVNSHFMEVNTLLDKWISVIPTELNHTQISSMYHLIDNLISDSLNENIHQHYYGLVLAKLGKIIFKYSYRICKKRNFNELKHHKKFLYNIIYCFLFSTEYEQIDFNSILDNSEQMKGLFLNAMKGTYLIRGIYISYFINVILSMSSSKFDTEFSRQIIISILRQKIYLHKIPSSYLCCYIQSINHLFKCVIDCDAFNLLKPSDRYNKCNLILIITSLFDYINELFKSRKDDILVCRLFLYSTCLMETFTDILKKSYFLNKFDFLSAEAFLAVSECIENLQVTRKWEIILVIIDEDNKTENVSSFYDYCKNKLISIMNSICSDKKNINLINTLKLPKYENVLRR